ncbi:hypothetical protein [Bradyrhizobium sp. CCBAU 53421]|nr:hypothetical protein [Bradyrhizobium sp. CCBAU 53421]
MHTRDIDYTGGDANLRRGAGLTKGWPDKIGDVVFDLPSRAGAGDRCSQS